MRVQVQASRRFCWIMQHGVQHKWIMQTALLGVHSGRGPQDSHHLLCVLAMLLSLPQVSQSLVFRTLFRAHLTCQSQPRHPAMVGMHAALHSRCCGCFLNYAVPPVTGLSQ